MRVPDFLLSQESRAERNKRERIAELTAQKNELLRQRTIALEHKARIEGWPGDRGWGGTSSEKRDDAVVVAELDQKITAVDEELKLLEAEAPGVE